jgi:hypothetical protein
MVGRRTFSMRITFQSEPHGSGAVESDKPNRSRTPFQLIEAAEEVGNVSALSFTADQSA